MSFTVLDREPDTGIAADEGPYLIVADFRFVNVEVREETDEVLTLRGNPPARVWCSPGDIAVGRGHRHERIATYDGSQPFCVDAAYGDELEVTFA